MEGAQASAHHWRPRQVYQARINRQPRGYYRLIHPPTRSDWRTAIPHRPRFLREATMRDESTDRVHRGQAVPRRQRNDEIAIVREGKIGRDDKPAVWRVGKGL